MKLQEVMAGGHGVGASVYSAGSTQICRPDLLSPAVACITQTTHTPLRSANNMIVSV